MHTIYDMAVLGTQLQGVIIIIWIPKYLVRHMLRNKEPIEIWTNHSIIYVVGCCCKMVELERDMDQGSFCACTQPMRDDITM